MVSKSQSPADLSHFYQSSLNIGFLTPAQVIIKIHCFPLPLFSVELGNLTSMTRRWGHGLKQNLDTLAPSNHRMTCQFHYKASKSLVLCVCMRWWEDPGSSVLRRITMADASQKGPLCHRLTALDHYLSHLSASWFLLPTHLNLISLFYLTIP